MFSGTDYKIQLEEAVEELQNTSNPEEIESILNSVEWVVAEAVSGSVIITLNIVTGLFLLPIYYLARPDDPKWWVGLIGVIAFFSVSGLLYQIYRLVVWWEISRPLKRKFGKLGLPDWEEPKPE